ncbi:MAG: 2-hydroxyacid dehydrogenase [Candidatus Endonucleobacter sp. (ex Gigantidas childressi)]|nr:2-hydroxyacid dehydrogenase [Candidatus Endonucleobacter sp. (ex Gigantidas childressi)]
MKVAIFGTKSWDKKYFLQENNKFKHDLVFIEEHLNSMTSILAQGCRAVCAFVNDELDGKCLRELSNLKIKTVAMRCAGFNNVNLSAASACNIKVANVPEYAPHGVAEHAVTLILALNRKIYKAYNRVREGNFLLEGLLGFNLNTKTIGVVGTGKIGSIFCKIMTGFGCTVLAYDPYENEECLKNGVTYSDLETLLNQSDIISIHCPLTPSSHHFINEKSISLMKDGVMLINTSRGALIDATAVIRSLKSGKIGYLGLDTYEEEAGLFFEDISNKIIADDTLARLLTFSNVLITGHQAFFTVNALENIAKTTLQNITDIEQNKQCKNFLT